MRGQVAIICVGIVLAGCAGADGPSPTPLPTLPVEPERLTASVDTEPEAMLTCGYPERTFPTAALGNPTGAEDEPGPMFDALREGIGRFDLTVAESPTWFVAQQDETGALFLARAESNTGWWVVVVEHDLRWRPAGGGSCNLHVQLSKDFGPAQWALDPAYPPPDASQIELHILVWELACHDEYAATGRISTPVVVYGADTVTVTIGVRPLEGEHTCPGTPGTPAILTLPEPLDGRTLLDGYTYPPVEPTPAFPIEGSTE